MSSALPTPTPEALALSQTLQARIIDALRAAGGWLAFSDFMRMALYTPGLGYYSGPVRKFGAEGDFVTAPELSSAFGRAIARTLAPVLKASAPNVLEFGAGTGKLAADVLEGLAELDCLPEQYAILEVSGSLRARQRETLASRVPQWLDRVVWLDALPSQWQGALIGNEVLDAMPCEILEKSPDGEVRLKGVAEQAGQLLWATRPASVEWQNRTQYWPAGMTSEVMPEAEGFVRALADSLVQGALLLIDYGFPAGEFYHPQRQQGTLMCHYRHHSHDDPFFLPGLQDITCHVDFSAIYQAGSEAGLMLEGYVSQGQYLLDAGILEDLARLDAHSSADAATAMANAQKLLSPSEMGELFKVIAFSRGLSLPELLPGFRRADRSAAL